MAIIIPVVVGRIGNTGQLCERITHRDSVASNDSAFPVDGDGSINCRSFSHAIIECVFSGSGSFDMTPGFFDGTNWFKGQKRVITENQRFVLEVDSADYLYILLDNLTDTPTVTVKVTPINYY